MRKFKVFASDESLKVLRDAQSTILDMLGKFGNTSHLAVNVSETYYGSVCVEVNNGETYTNALCWSFTAILKDNNVEMATNSWSGLNAVGSDKLDDLENSVELLKGLNELD